MKKQLKKKSIIFTQSEFIRYGLHVGQLKRLWHRNSYNFLLKIENAFWHIFNISRTIYFLNKALTFLKKNLLKKKNILFLNIFANKYLQDSSLSNSKQLHKDLVSFATKIPNLYYIGKQDWLPGLITNFVSLSYISNKIINKRKYLFYNTLFPLQEDLRYKLIKLHKTPLYDEYFIKYLKNMKKFVIKKKFKSLLVLNKMKSLPETVILLDPAYISYAIAEANILGTPLICLINTDKNPIKISYPIPINTRSFFSKKLIYILVKLVYLESKINYIKLFFI